MRKRHNECSTNLKTCSLSYLLERGENGWIRTSVENATRDIARVLRWNIVTVEGTWTERGNERKARHSTCRLSRQGNAIRLRFYAATVSFLHVASTTPVEASRTMKIFRVAFSGSMTTSLGTHWCGNNKKYVQKKSLVETRNSETHFIDTHIDSTRAFPSDSDIQACVPAGVGVLLFGIRTGSFDTS